MRLIAVVIALTLAACSSGSGDDGEDTTVQLRPVIGRAGDCKPLTENPPVDEPVSLELSGRCIGLAPSVLTIKKAGVRAATVNQTGVVAAQVKLTDQDTRALTEVSQQFLGKEVGLVAFGKLLVAPVFNEPITTGEIEILGLSKPEIDALQKALAP